MNITGNTSKHSFSEVDPAHQRDGYYASIADLLEHCADHNLTPPEYAWACDQTFPQTRAEGVIEQGLDEHHSDASSEVNHVQARELQEFLDAWWKDTGISSYYMDYDRAVVLNTRLPGSVQAT